MSNVKVPYMGLKPKEISNTAWRTIVEAWQNGLSDREAAFRASRNSKNFIKASDIQRWFRENPDIEELKLFLLDDLLSESKMTVADSIRCRDVRTAKWFLERKAPNEFSTKAAIAFEGAAVELTLEEKEKKMQEFMDGFGGDNG